MKKGNGFEGSEFVGGRKPYTEPMVRVSGTPEFYGSVELLQELMDASAPYLRRKKMTPRHQCNELNRVWAKCSDYLEKQNAQNQRTETNKGE